MKRTKFWGVAAALLVAAGIMTACSDDHKDIPDSRLVTEGDKTSVPSSQLTDEENYLIDCQFTIMRIMSQLADVDEVTPDVVNHTYEPAYGSALDGEDSPVRSVKCQSVAEAEEMFRSIAGIDSASSPRLLTPTADGYALSLTDLPILPDGKKFTLGTLTFHRDDGVRRMGYVDVAISCIPHLERIDFLSPEAFPDNAGGNSAYILGDIVRVTSGYCTGYYLCIKQYDGSSEGWLVHMCVNEPGGDETVNLDDDSEGCFYPYNRDKGQKTTADMVKTYCNFIIDNKAKVENIKAFLNGDLAEKKPYASGKMWHIFPEGFNNSYGMPFVSSDGRGAAVWYEADFNEYAWVPAYHYRRGNYVWVRYNSETATDEYYKYVYDSDWNSNWSKRWNYCMNAIRFSRNPISGSTLAYSPTNDQVVHKNDAVNVSSRHLGWCYADNNRLYETPWEAVNAGHTPLGVVVYVNDGSAFGNAVTEKENGAGHALVMSYSEEKRTSSGSYSVRWNNSSSGIVSLDPQDAFTQWVNRGTGAAAALSDFKGYEKTLYLAEVGSYAAQCCRDHKPAAPKLSNTGWFIPSAAQWIAIMCKPGLGGATMPSTSAGFPTYLESGSTAAFSRINAKISQAPTYLSFHSNDEHWTSSAYASSIGVYLTGTNSSTRLTYWNWGNYAFVRPVFAF